VTDGDDGASEWLVTELLCSVLGSGIDGLRLSEVEVERFVLVLPVPLDSVFLPFVFFFDPPWPMLINVQMCCESL